MSLPTYVFAKDPEQIASYVSDCWEGQNGYRNFDLMRRNFSRAYIAYYGQTWGYEHSTVKVGEQGEFTGININELRSNIKGVISMTTQNRVVFDCVTTSTDVQAQNNVIIGNTLLEQKFDVGGVEAKAIQMLEQGLVFDTAYMFVGFKTGDDIAGINGEGAPVYKGEMDVKVLSKLDVMVEPCIEQWDEHEYVMFRRIENRYNLAAKYPEVSEDILRLPIPTNLLMVRPGATIDEQANVWVYYTFHKPTKAMPQGLMHVCLDARIVLFSDVNPYECLPVVCYRPHMVYGSAHGHALAYDLMPAQEALNTLDSSMLTMAENFAIPNIIAGNSFRGQETTMSGGMKLLTGVAEKDAPNGGFPMAMDMPKPDQVYMQLGESYQARIVSLSGLNAAARGQAQAQQSGTAIALAQSAAQTNNASIENGYITALEHIAGLILRVCRLFLTQEEIIEQAGLSLEYQASTYANASLDSISRVKIDTGNALGKTVSGRLEIATQLLNQAQISPTEYLSILQTGNLPKTVQSKTSGDSLISKENEMLITGAKPIMSVLDHHVNHINAHKSVLDNPNLRAESTIVALVMEHIEEHLNMMEQLQMSKPQLLDIALGQPLGTTAQANAQMAPPPGAQPPQGAPAPSGPAEGSADAAMESGGVDAVAESGRGTAERKLASIAGEELPVESIGG